LRILLLTKIMRRRLSLFYILLCIILIGNTCGSAATTIVPREGTVYLGEEGLDLSQTSIRSGAEIAWWSGGEPSGMPLERYKVPDAKNFDISYDIFGGRTGSWYTLEGKNLAFTVEEPFFEMEVEESGWDWEKEWIKRGNLITFTIKSNLIAIANRQGSNSIPITIILTGPDDTEYTEVKLSASETYTLQDILAYYNPFSTGAVWDTGLTEYPDGTYTISAYTNVNNVNERAPADGMTRTEKKTFILQKTDPADDTPQPTVQPETTSDEEDAENTDINTSEATKDGISTEPAIIETTLPTPVRTPEVRVTLVEKTTIQPPRKLQEWKEKTEMIPVTTTQASSSPGFPGCIAVILALAILIRKR